MLTCGTNSYTAPQEQRQILRIVNLPFFYCLFNFLALSFYDQCRFKNKVEA